jgi:hypothetical protein
MEGKRTSVKSFAPLNPQSKSPSSQALMAIRQATNGRF